MISHTTFCSIGAPFGALIQTARELKCLGLGYEAEGAINGLLLSEQEVISPINKVFADLAAGILWFEPVNESEPYFIHQSQLPPGVLEYVLTLAAKGGTINTHRLSFEDLGDETDSLGQDHG